MGVKKIKIATGSEADQKRKDLINSMSFEDIKASYAEYRKKEQKKIVEYLAQQKDIDTGKALFTYTTKDGGKVVLGGFGKCGRHDYGTTRRTGAFDLSNWKWIDTTYEDQEVKASFFISLQTFDIDPSSKNIHVLYDRVGIYKYDVTGKEKKIKVEFCDEERCITDPVFNMVQTRIDLPMDNAKLENLVNILKMMAIEQ